MGPNFPVLAQWKKEINIKTKKRKLKKKETNLMWMQWWRGSSSSIPYLISKLNKILALKKNKNNNNNNNNKISSENLIKITNFWSMNIEIEKIIDN